MTREFPIKTSARTGVLTVTESPDRVDIRLTFDRYGDCGDAADIVRQLFPILRRFDRDPRPINLDAPDFGHRAEIDFDGRGNLVTVLTKETRQ